MTDKELIEVLCSISEVSARLARNIMKRKEKTENDRYCAKTQRCCPAD